MSTDPTLAMLEATARALARRDGLEPALQAILGAMIRELGIASAAVFVVGREADRLTLAAWIGFNDPEALAAAVRRPGHPIAATMHDRAATFDVRPTAAGGPALRGHLPLLIGGEGGDVAVGVLALAYDDPLGPGPRRILAATADLIAVAVDRDLPVG